MFNKQWSWLPRFVSANSVGMGRSGNYFYTGATSGTWNLVNAVQIGQNPQDERVFVVSHMGGDAAILTLTTQASDRLYEPSIAGAIGQTLGSNGVTGQTRTTIQLVKGDVAYFTVIGRLWTWYVVRPATRTVSVPSGTAAYQVKPYDNLVLMDSTGVAQDVTLPPIAQMLVNGESRPVEVMLTAGANTARVLASGAETISGSASPLTLASVGSKYRVRPISSTNWGVF